MELPYRYNRQPEGLQIHPAYGLPAEIEQQLRDQIWFDLVTGSQDAESFTENYAVDYANHLDEDQMQSIYSDLLLARRKQQSSWGAEEPRPNLTEAFDELNEAAILALEDITCCGTCAADEVWAELDEDEPQPLYLYFHHQNTERFVSDREGWVGFGAVLGALGVKKSDWQALTPDEQTRRYNQITEDLVKQRILPVLAKHGIEVDWDGSAKTNLHLLKADYYCEVD